MMHPTLMASVCDKKNTGLSPSYTLLAVDVAGLHVANTGMGLAHSLCSAHQKDSEAEKTGDYFCFIHA